MSDSADVSTRPAKRARLDDSTGPSLSADSTAPVPPTTAKAPVATTTLTIDDDLARETRAGITEYVCPDNLGFMGVLKQRYTDFLVNEIGLDGRVLHLTSTEVPKKGSTKSNETRANGTEKEKAEEMLVLKEDTGDAQTVLTQNGEKAQEPTQMKDENASTNEPVNEQPSFQQEKVQEQPAPQLSDEHRDTLHSIYGEDTTEQILTLVRQIRRREHVKAKEFKAVTSLPITDKETRTEAHRCLRRIFPGLLESTMEENQSIRIKATPPAERKGKKKGKGNNQDRGEPGTARKKGQAMWDELGGDYLHFNLYKENKDTMEIVGFLGSKLNCGSKGFGFAGTKDRRACTVQRVCVKKQTAERMQSFNKILYNAALGDFEYRSNDLSLGDLRGNEFTITLRNCQFQSEEGLGSAQRQKFAQQVVEKAIQDFSEKGFINYYGLQRFGSFAASTDAIGRKMLQSDFKGAVEDLLAYNDVALAAAEGTLGDSPILVSQDDRNRAKALHIWKTEESSNAALDILPKKFTAERNIIQHLGSRNGKTGRYDRMTDWQGALMTIPRNLRLMYVHAYQSLVWNIVAGKRWTVHGDKVVEGDLVLVNEHRDKAAAGHAPKAENEDQDGEFIINPTGTENANAVEEEFERARPLTASEVSSGNYTVWDVVLPQPGYDVEYPKNAIGEFYKEFMGSEKGGGLDPYNMRRPWREVSLSGGYRKFLARPLQPLSFEVHQYTKEDEQFVETDMDRLKKKKTGAKNEGIKEDVDMEDGEEADSEKLAVVVKLQLASSQYATVALRELMKAGGVKAFKPGFGGGR